MDQPLSDQEIENRNEAYLKYRKRVFEKDLEKLRKKQAIRGISYKEFEKLREEIVSIKIKLQDTEKKLEKIDKKHKTQNKINTREKTAIGESSIWFFNDIKKYQ